MAGRRVRVAALLLLSMFAVPVAAHGGEHVCGDPLAGLNHLRIWEETLAAGESAQALGIFDGCPLRAGWWMAVWMEAPEGFALTIEHENQDLGTWDMQGYAHVQLPVDGFPEFTVTASQPGTFRLYFDQTCACTGKGIPINGGSAWFNVEAAAGETVTFDFRFTPVWSGLQAPAMPDQMRVELAWVEPTDNGPVVIEREIVTFHETCVETRFTGCHEYSFTAERDGTQYVWVTTAHNGDDGWIIQAAPELRVGLDAPGPGVWVGIVILFGLALKRRG